MRFKGVHNQEKNFVDPKLVDELAEGAPLLGGDERMRNILSSRGLCLGATDAAAASPAEPMTVVVAAVAGRWARATAEAVAKAASAGRRGGAGRVGGGNVWLVERRNDSLQSAVVARQNLRIAAGKRGEPLHSRGGGAAIVVIVTVVVVVRPHAVAVAALPAEEDHAELQQVRVEVNKDSTEVRVDQQGILVDEHVHLDRPLVGGEEGGGVCLEAERGL